MTVYGLIPSVWRRAFGVPEPAPACEWCGHLHEAGELCREAPRGLTRRSFLFLGAAAAVGALLPAPPYVPVPGTLWRAAAADRLLKDIYAPGIHALLNDATILVVDATTRDAYLGLTRGDWPPPAIVEDRPVTYNDVVRSTRAPFGRRP